MHGRELAYRIVILLTGDVPVAAYGEWCAVLCYLTYLSPPTPVAPESDRGSANGVWKMGA